jgi:transposase-like protein
MYRQPGKACKANATKRAKRTDPDNVQIDAHLFAAALGVVGIDHVNLLPTNTKGLPMDNVANVSERGEFAGVIQLDEGKVRAHLDGVVRDTVEQTLNALLEAEADVLCGAKRYERHPERLDTRAGHYERQLHTKAGEVTLQVPRLRTLPFETAIIERYRRRESSVEEALMEMYLAGVSVRRVEDITEVLWGTRVSPSTVSELNQKIYSHIEAWRNRPVEGEHPYVYLDGIWLKRSWGGEVRNVAVLVALAVRADGHREIVGVAEGAKEDADSWRHFLRHLKERGLTGVRLFISDKCLGLVEALGEFYPGAAWQRCMVHWYRNVLRVVPRGRVKEVAAMLKAIHGQEDRPAAQQKAQAVVEKLEGMRLGKAGRSSAKALTRRWRTWPSRASTGRGFAPTMCWSGSCARSGGGRGWWATSRMVSRQ